MRSFISWLISSISMAFHTLIMPLLSGIGGIAATIAVPTLRGLAGVCFIVAAVALASDMGMATMDGAQKIRPTAVSQHWQQVTPSSFEATRSFIVKRARPWVWDAFSTPLRMPTFVFFALGGLLFGYLGRRRNRVNIFAN